MKKQTLRYRFALISVILITVLIFSVSCAAATKGSYSQDASSEKNLAGFDTVSPDYDGADKGGIGNVPTSSSGDPNAKIIKTANARLTTLDFDTFIEKLYEKITELEGYTDNDTFSGSKPSRYASITVRIPAAKLDEFKNHLSANATLTYYSAEKQDVTIRYATLTAELESLKQKRDAISSILDKATSLSEIQSLTSARCDVDTEINKISAELEAYDEKISYSTVYVTVNEVKEYIAPEPEEEKGVFERIGEGFVKNLKNVGNFFVEFFVWFISAIPYLIIVGALGTGLGFILFKVKKKKAPRKAEPEERSEEIASEDTGSEESDDKI